MRLNVTGTFSTRGVQRDEKQCNSYYERSDVEAEEHAIEEEVDENERKTPSIQVQPNKKSWTSIRRIGRQQEELNDNEKLSSNRTKDIEFWILQALNSDT